MSSRVSIQQTISVAAPADAQIGDEWYNISTGVLSKRTLLNGVPSWLTMQVGASGSFTATTVSISSSTGAVTIAGGLGVGGSMYAGTSVYVGNRVGYVNSSNASVAYQFYNTATNSIDTVFG